MQLPYVSGSQPLGAMQLPYASSSQPLGAVQLPYESSSQPLGVHPESLDGSQQLPYESWPRHVCSGVQVPSMQSESELHLLPHPPQFELSLRVSTHWCPQAVNGPVQPHDQSKVPYVVRALMVHTQSKNT